MNEACKRRNVDNGALVQIQGDTKNGHHLNLNNF